MTDYLITTPFYIKTEYSCKTCGETFDVTDSLQVPYHYSKLVSTGSIIEYCAGSFKTPISVTQTQLSGRG